MTIGGRLGAMDPTRYRMVGTNPLDRDSLVYLAGSICIDDLIRRRDLSAALKRLYTIHRLVRRGRPADIDALAALPAMPDRDALANLLERFDAQPRKWPDRQAAGIALLGYGFFPAGLCAALTVLAVREIAARRGRPLPHPLHDARRRRAVPARKLLEPWDDVDTSAGSLPEISYEPVGQPAGLRRTPPAQPVRLDPWDAAETAGGAAAPAQPDSAVPAGPEDQAWLSRWLCGLGFDNSGVRIEAYAERIAGTASQALVRSLRRQAGQGTAGDRVAVANLLRSADAAGLSHAPLLMLRRLEAVLRLSVDGMALPARNARSAYVPVAGRLLYLTHMRDPYELNGYVVRTHFVLKILSEAGFEPEAHTRLGFPNDLARHRTVAVPAEAQVVDHVFRSMPDPGGGLIGRALDDYIAAYADRIVAIARDRRPALIHAASNHLNGLAAIIAGRRLGIPAVYEVRGIWEITQASSDDAYAQTLRYQLSRTLENQAVGEADHVVAISEQLRRFVIEHGARPSSVSVLPNGVDAAHMHDLPPDPALKAELGIAPDAVVIGYAGSVVRYEGLDFVIEAMDRLRKRGVGPFHLLLIGDGRELAALKALAAERNLRDLCTFTGRVPRDRIEALFRVIDIAPLPRRSLPVTELVPPLKPFEAMAAGKAVVVSSTAAIAETVIDGQTGLVVEKNSIAALADALQRLIEDADLRARLSRQGRDWVLENRTAQRLVRDVREIYERLS